MPDDDSETTEYHGLDVDHRENDDAPDLYVLTSGASELTDWAEVPRSNADFMNGYQRQLKEHRLEEIKDFLSTDINIIPGAILVTVNEEYLEIEEQEGDRVDITISSPPERTVKELLEEAYENLYHRLEETGQEYVDQVGEDYEPDAEDGVDEEDMSDGNGEDPVSYLARKTGELKKSLNNWDHIDQDKKDLLGEYAERVHKPGLIIDGQHRVFGAKKYQEEIRYPIVLIPGLEEKEQVYHFYIINDKAEPISQEELLITVATALSEKESNELMDRLLRAGVDVDKARYPYMADVEERSPFHQMINYEEKVGEQTGAIDFKDMYMLMNRFVEMKGGHDALYENIEEWDDVSYRINKFYTFWSAIKDHYDDLWEDAEAAREGREDFDEEYPEQFFRKDPMRVLQEYILEELADKQENRQEFLDELEEDVRDSLWEYVLEDDEVFTEEIQNIVDDIPEKFYRDKWNTGGLSTSENRRNFREELEKAADTNEKGLPRLRIFNKGF
ncbi:hypothetical protein [Natrinema pallidum]|uniref:DGQHR domain-containing protein n=1 Tax=Natrinema pallidum TaxID=69527 RepID=A0A4V1IF69_9EURY|nr:hypothetical protein [Natrinema pallidum]QCW03954.1 hypothetical protein FGF80_12205 [Natrinema pallidum]